MPVAFQSGMPSLRRGVCVSRVVPVWPEYTIQMSVWFRVNLTKAMSPLPPGKAAWAWARGAQSDRTATIESTIRMRIAEASHGCDRVWSRVRGCASQVASAVVDDAHVEVSDARTERFSSLTVFACALAAIAAIGVLDYATGPYFSLTLFYLAPIWLVTAYVGRPAGIMTAIGCSVVSLT